MKLYLQDAYKLLKPERRGALRFLMPATCRLQGLMQPVCFPGIQEPSHNLDTERSIPSAQKMLSELRSYASNLTGGESRPIALKAPGVLEYSSDDVTAYGIN
jgi:hypothetical protein